MEILKHLSKASFVMEFPDEEEEENHSTAHKEKRVCIEKSKVFNKK